MKNLNLNTSTISKTTIKNIDLFVYENRYELSNELKMFYKDVAGLIEIQLKKSLSRRMNMNQIMERAYNIDSYVIATGAASFDKLFI